MNNFVNKPTEVRNIPITVNGFKLASNINISTNKAPIIPTYPNGAAMEAFV